MKEDMDLAARYARWDTADLARAATAEASDFRPEALAAMRLELERRGQAVGPVPPAPAAAREEPKGVGGFLLFLLVLLGWASITRLFTGIAYMFMMPDRLADLLIDAGWAFLGVYGFYCCRLLLRKDRRAPARTAAWFVADTVLTIAFVAHAHFASEPSMPPFMSDISITGVVLIFQIVYSGIWLAYLARSKRVKATFGAPFQW